MRWIPFIVLAYVVLVVQTGLCRLLTFSAGGAGLVWPDLLALTAAVIAILAREDLDAMLAAWALGLAADLTTGAAVGVMPVTYVLAAWVVFRMREAFFRDRFSTRMLLTLLFCLIAEPLWVTGQAALAWRVNTWDDYKWTMLQAVLVSAYTAAIAPIIGWPLMRIEGLPSSQPAGRGRR